jgi:hypothetical protein
MQEAENYSCNKCERLKLHCSHNMHRIFDCPKNKGRNMYVYGGEVETGNVLIRNSSGDFCTSGRIFFGGGLGVNLYLFTAPLATLNRHKVWFIPFITFLKILKEKRR